MKKNHYRSDIDGLRAVAVVSVIFFHLGVPQFRGGFVGVDVFFVISGFLITRLIKEEIDSTGSFDFKNFYLRRIRRLFPALFATLVLTTVVASFLLSPVHLQRFGGALASALTSLSNFYFWLEADYFDVSAQVKPLLHTWSLSIEEQFYLVWPVMIFLLYKLKTKWMPLFVLLSVSCFSLCMNFEFSDGSVGIISKYSATLSDLIADGRPTIFFLMPFRFFEFAIGASLVWLIRYRAKSKLIHELLFCVGMGLIFYAVVSFNDEMLFPAWLALVPCLGSALLIYSGASSFLSILLTNKVSVGMGLISYSLYLVHWPIIVFWSYICGDLSFAQKTLIMMSSLSIGYLSYQYIERPFRNKKIIFEGFASKFCAVLSVLLVAALGIHMNQDGGWPWRTAPSISVRYIGERGVFHDDFYGGAGYPSYGPVNTQEPADIVLMGDSHGLHYADGIYKEWAEPEGMSLYMASGTSCFHLPDFTRTTEGRDWDEDCPNRMKLALSSIDKAKSPPVVIVSHSWVSQMERADILDEHGRRRNVNIAVTDIVQGIRALKQRIGDSPLVVIGQVPTAGGHDLYDIFTRPRPPFFSDFDPQDYLKAPARADLVQFNQHLSQAAKSTGDFIFLDPHEVLCEEGSCRNTDDQNRPIYSDTSHLSKYGSREVIRTFLPRLKSI